MRILYIVDGRSPTARNWIAHFIAAGHEVHMISTSRCTRMLDLASLHILPVAFSDAGMPEVSDTITQVNRRDLLRRLTPMWARTFIRQWLGPLTLPKTVRKLKSLIDQIQPDVVHAMRYPYEGIMTALAEPDAPLIVSVWGNDFTLHAKANPLIGRYTRRALARTDALHTDCQRDQRLAHKLGFPQGRPSVVLPGSGGIRTEVFHPPAQPRPEEPPVIINPRGFRSYVRNDVFFKAIPLVLAQFPQARFLCPAMSHETQAQKWVADYQIGEAVELLPRVPQGKLADLYRRAHVVVSPSTHDGTPNTLLEAMACGCFPVAGDIESIREWLKDGENALMVDPGDPQALAAAIIQALRNADLRRSAREANRKLVAERAIYSAVMAQADSFYKEVLGD